MRNLTRRRWPGSASSPEAQKQPICVRPPSQMVRSASVQPLCRAVLVEQARGDGPRGDARVAGQLPGRGYKQCRAPLLEWPGHRDLVNQRNAAVPESGMAGLPRDPA